MKVGFVDNSLGAQINFRGDVINYLYSKGFEIVMISPKDTELVPNNKIKYYNIKGERKTKNIIKDIFYLKKLYQIYKKEKFDLIFHYTIKPNIYGTIAAKLNKQRSIAIVPGMGYTFIKENYLSKIVKMMYKFSLKYSEEVWFLNKEDKQYFVDNRLIDFEKTKLLPGEGINLKKFKLKKIKDKREKIVFLMVARVLWDKGFKEYVESAEKILKKYKNIEFHLLGMIDSDNPSGVTKEIIDFYHTQKIIKYLGETNDVVKIIEECDCLVLPSFYKEGLPRTLMEGAAMEKPLITTDNVGCREAVDDGVNGYLCEIKNSEDLAEKMEKMILLSHEERVEMGKKGRKKMEIEFCNEIIFNIYNEKVEKYKKI